MALHCETSTRAFHRRQVWVPTPKVFTINNDILRCPEVCATYSKELEDKIMVAAHCLHECGFAIKIAVFLYSLTSREVFDSCAIRLESKITPIHLFKRYAF